MLVNKISNGDGAGHQRTNSNLSNKKDADLIFNKLIYLILVFSIKSGN